MTAGVTLALTGLANGTTVNLLGDVTFGVKHWAGPLMTIGTKSPNSILTFNGNGASRTRLRLSWINARLFLGYTLDGQGQQYWDGKGANGGVTKPVSLIFQSPCSSNRTGSLQRIL